MSDYTYEAHSVNQALETFEWDNNWLEHCENTAAPRVLYVGDSISCGTRKAANKLANGELLFDGVGTSKAVDNPYLTPMIKLWGEQEGHRKFLLFNNGLHGWHMDVATYAAAYERAVTDLRQAFPDTPPILLLTTHVADPERDREVVERNRAVLAIATRQGLPVIDLYAPTLENRHLLSPDGVHLIPEGYDLIAQAILTFLTRKGETK